MQKVRGAKMSTRGEERKEAILRSIHEYITQIGYPPTVREIGAKVSLASPSTVFGYLAELQTQGYIQKDGTKTRTLELTNKGLAKIGASRENAIPVLGDVQAGQPILTEQVAEVEDYFPQPDNLKNYNASDLFMLSVRGESMINVGIFEGDQLIIKRQPNASNGQIVVAQTENGEITVKRFYREKGYIRLHPENDNMEDIFLEEGRIVGLVVGLYRTDIN